MHAWSYKCIKWLRSPRDRMQLIDIFCYTTLQMSYMHNVTIINNYLLTYYSFLVWLFSYFKESNNVFMLTDSPRVLSTFTKLYSQKWSHFKDIDIKVILHSVYLQNLKCNGYIWKQVWSLLTVCLSLNLSIHNIIFSPISNYSSYYQ